ncbi:hypothetical protein FPOA_09123 [Fusarium poae]|uniref:BTB domain-containing protein n=1 Tax=Fusarium poae TaxID=36050 RepID=A0A1B8AQZ1_FUSPO|nr:hypothetical protein FPOA_09123 [Fusarium poae]
MESPDPNTDKVIEIDPDGDIILLVGPDKTKLRVRSILLMAASKPFSAMLGPQWKEGHDMREQHGRFELPLPDDNAAALEIICYVIHYQNDKLPQTLAANDILAIAMTADKYDFVNALRFASESWFRTFGDEPESLVLLTASAYIFRNAQAFSEITRALVLNYSGSYLNLRTDEVESVMPWRVFFLLEEQRGFARMKLSHILVSGGGADLCFNECDWTSKYTHAYRRALQSEFLLPGDLQSHSISRALEKSEMMTDPVFEERSGRCKFGYNHEAPAYREDRRRDLDNLIKKLGLCLHCTSLERADASCNHPSHMR